MRLFFLFQTGLQNEGAGLLSQELELLEKQLEKMDLFMKKDIMFLCEILIEKENLEAIDDLLVITRESFDNGSSDNEGADVHKSMVNRNLVIDDSL